MIIIFRICITKRKTIKRLGDRCCGCWLGCRKKSSDRDEKGSGRDFSHRVNPGKRNSKETVEMKSLAKDTSAPEKPRRIGKRVARTNVHSTGSITAELARQLTGEERNYDLPWPESYGPDPELARKYLEEKSLMSKK